MKKTIGQGQRTTLAAAVIAVLAVLCAQPLRASTVYVGTCVAGGTHYTTIQAAINAVSAGSTIRVCPGNYPEQIVINKKLTLTGVASATAENPTLVIPEGGFVSNATSIGGAPVSPQIFVESPATGVTISYLAVDGTGNTSNSCTDSPLIGIYFQNASGSLLYDVARNQAQEAESFGCQTSAGLGIYVESGNSGTSTVAIDYCTVHGFQKNGITANETGTTVTIFENSVVGAGPIDTAQNGIQVALGAAGTIEDNIVVDLGNNSDPELGLASGILVFGSGGLTISGNNITNTQTGIATVSGDSLTADGNIVTGNRVTNTHIGDALDLCSNNNMVTSNTLWSSDEAGIHLDSTCGGTGNGNSVSKNVVNEACAGTLVGGSGNTIAASNELFNVANLTLNGDACPVIGPSVVSNIHTNAVRPNSSKGHTFAPARP